MPWDQESFGVIADNKSPCRSPMFSTTSTCYRHVLQTVGATALAVLQVFVDWQAKEEETLEQMREAMDDMVDAGHGVNDGEDFDFSGNDVDL